MVNVGKKSHQSVGTNRSGEAERQKHAKTELTRCPCRRTVVDCHRHSPTPDGTASPMSASHAPLTQHRRKEGRGYAWALALSALVWIAASVLVGFGFFGVPGRDLVRQGGWFFTVWLLMITPAGIVLALMSCGLVALFRKLGARYLPGVVQALPAVAIVCGLIFLFFRWLFAPAE